MRCCSTRSSAKLVWNRRAATSGCPAAGATLAPSEPAIAELERRLTADAFHAPEADELAALGLGARELAAAERAGRLLRLRDGVVLLPTAPALAMRTLSRLEQPFTTSQARQALGHNPPGRGSAARAPRLTRLDPAAGRRSPQGGALIICHTTGAPTAQGPW